MEHAVLPRLVFHQQIEASRGAVEHVTDIACRQDHALGLARCSRRIDNGDWIRLGELWVPIYARSRVRKYLIEQILRRCFRPSLENILAQGGVAATDQRWRAILHHGDDLSRRLPRVKWNYDEPFGHDREIESDPFDAVRRKQRATVAFL